MPRRDKLDRLTELLEEILDTYPKTQIEMIRESNYGCITFKAKDEIFNEFFTLLFGLRNGQGVPSEKLAVINKLVRYNFDFVTSREMTINTSYYLESDKRKLHKKNKVNRKGLETYMGQSMWQRLTRAYRVILNDDGEELIRERTS